MIFAKLGKELGSFVDSMQSGQKRMEGQLASMDSMLRDVYSEMKKMNNRVDTVDFQIKLLKEQLQEMNNTVVMAPMELHQAPQTHIVATTNQPLELQQPVNGPNNQLSVVNPNTITATANSAVADSVNEYIKTVVTGTITDTDLPEMISKEINRTVKNVDTDAAHVAEKSCEEVLRTFGIVRDDHAHHLHQQQQQQQQQQQTVTTTHSTFIANQIEHYAPVEQCSYYVQVPHNSDVQYMFQAAATTTAPPPPSALAEHLQVHVRSRLARLPSLFQIDPSKLAAEVQIVPNSDYLSPIGKAGGGSKGSMTVSNKLLTSIITPDKTNTLVTPSKAHSTPVASIIGPTGEKQSRRKSFQANR